MICSSDSRRLLQYVDLVLQIFGRTSVPRCTQGSIRLVLFDQPDSIRYPETMQSSRGYPQLYLPTEVLCGS